MPNIMDRFLTGLRGKREAAKPMQAQGVPGFQAFGGYIARREKNGELIGSQRWTTASDILTNVSVIAASMRFILNLVARPTWRFEPADDSKEAEEMAEFMEDLIYDLDTSWTRVVRRMAMYRYFGFGMHEWVAKKNDDGKVVLESLDSRPCHSIDRWDLDENGKVIGVWQRDPQTGQEVYLPRKKVVYLVDDAMTDLPDGMGWFRHLAEPANALRALLDLERIGFERDLRGTPIGRAPIRKLNEMVQSGQLTQEQVNDMVNGLKSFVALERKTSETGIVLDSSPYESKTDSGVSPGAALHWGLDLLTGEPASMEALGKAVNRLATDMALIMGTDVILTGRDGEGSRALSEDKSRNLYLSVNSMLGDIAEAVDRDVIPIIWEMNGFDDKLRPTASPEDVSFRDVKDVADTLATMVDAGYMLAPDDPAFDYLRDLPGLPAGEPIDAEMMQAMQGMGKPAPGEEGKPGQPGQEGQPPKGPKLNWRDDQAENDNADAKAEAAAKAAPRPLYVYRKLKNAREVIRWAKVNGFKTTLPASDMHVTLLYSKRPVDPMAMGTGFTGEKVTVGEGGPRALERFGDAVVLSFRSNELEWRHEQMVDDGASHDYGGYQPHITLSWTVPADFDLDAVEPYQGKLVFGPETFETINPDWEAGLIEKFDASQPRWPKGDDRGGRWRPEYGMGGAEGDVSFEVAPNPDNEDLTRRWDSLTDEEKLAISDKLSNRFTPRVMEALGIEDYEVVDTMGGFEGHTNPAYMIHVNDRAFDVAGAVGDAYAQKAMVAWGQSAGDGFSEVGIADVFAPDASPELLTSIASDLGPIGESGWTYTDGRVRFLNFSGKSNEEFAADIDERLGGAYEVGHGTAYSAYITENNYARPQADAGGTDWREVRGAIRDEFAAAMAEELGSVGKAVAEAIRKAIEMIGREA